MPQKSESNTLSQCLIILGSNSEKKMTRRKRDRIRRWTYIFDAVIPGIFFYAAISSGKSTTDLLFISIANCFYVYLHSTRMFASTNHLFPLAILLTSKPFIQQASLFFTVNHFVVFLGGFFMQQGVFVWVHKAVNIILTKKDETWSDSHDFLFD